MSTLTIRLPDSKHERLKAFARERGVSVNKLVEDLATVALAQAGAENRYLLRKARGKPTVGLQLLDNLIGRQGESVVRIGLRLGILNCHSTPAATAESE